MMQTTNNILLVRPASFGFNAETAASNAFQAEIAGNPEKITRLAQAEFDAFVETLRTKDVSVFVFDDVEFPKLPDAVFPNNWVTFHADGTVILYPMAAPNRRGERRIEIIDRLRDDFQITNVIDLSPHEKENRFLEGTGSIVFDHRTSTAYASLSARTDEALFRDLCSQLDYEPIVFRSHDAAGDEIYHTNVMMCIGKGFAVICLDSISKGRVEVVEKLKNGHEIVDITFEQMNRFAGNMLALGDNLLTMSQRAFDSLTSHQRQRLENYCELVPLKIDTIETVGGGSARCMIAEVFLTEKDLDASVDSDK